MGCEGEEGEGGKEGGSTLKREQVGVFGSVRGGGGLGGEMDLAPAPARESETRRGHKRGNQHVCPIRGAFYELCTSILLCDLPVCDQVLLKPPAIPPKNRITHTYKMVKVHQHFRVPTAYRTDQHICETSRI